MEPKLRESVTDGIATVVIANPAKRNAMSAGMWRALPDVLERLAADPAVRVLVLTGEGDTFCAGADIAALREPGDEQQRLAVRAEEALAAFPKPTLAAVRGFCVGAAASSPPPATCGSPRRAPASGSPPRSSASSTRPRRPAASPPSWARRPPSTCCSPAN